MPRNVDTVLLNAPRHQRIVAVAPAVAELNVGEWAGLIGTTIALIGSAGAGRRWYRRTLGRRRDAYERLSRLGTGAHLSFFESVLGEPPAIRNTVVKSDYREVVTEGDPRFDINRVGDPEVDGLSHDVHEARSFLRSIFVDRNYFVQTITDDDGTVLAFSVTTRNRRFKPTFEWPPNVGWRERRRISKRVGEEFRPLFRVQLGRSRFSDFGDIESDHFAGPRFVISMGAHNYAYSEFHSYGNPGGYQSFVFTASDVAPGPFGDGSRVQEEVGGDEWPTIWPGEDDGRSWTEMTAAREFRRLTVVTTYTAIGLGLWDENFPTTFAPHETVVRTLP